MSFCTPYDIHNTHSFIFFLFGVFVYYWLLCCWLFRSFFSLWVTPFWAVLPTTPSLLGKVTRCSANISYQFHRMDPGYTTRHLQSHSRRINVVKNKHFIFRLADLNVLLDQSQEKTLKTQWNIIPESSLPQSAIFLYETLECIILWTPLLFSNDNAYFINK